MATLTGVGIGNANFQAQSQNSQSASSTKKFDVLVYPTARCKLHFEVLREESSGITATWKAVSEVMEKQTILHVTVPASATSWGFFVQTNQANNSSAYFYHFRSVAIEVFEDQPTSLSLERFPINRHTVCDVDKVRSKHFTNAEERTLTVDEVKSLVKDEKKA